MTADAFFTDPEYRMRTVTLAAHAGWLPRPGSSMELDLFLLPDGPGCPAEEAGVALREALLAKEAEAGIDH